MRNLNIKDIPKIKSVGNFQRQQTPFYYTDSIIGTWSGATLEGLFTKALTKNVQWSRMIIKRIALTIFSYDDASTEVVANKIYFENCYFANGNNDNYRKGFVNATSGIDVACILPGENLFPDGLEITNGALGSTVGPTLVVNVRSTAPAPAVDIKTVIEIQITGFVV